MSLSLELDATTTPSVPESTTPHPLAVSLDVGYSPIRQLEDVAGFLFAVFLRIDKFSATGQWEGDDTARRYFKRWNKAVEIFHDMAREAERPRYMSVGLSDTDEEV
nr:predicted protein [Mycena chlorophos]